MWYKQLIQCTKYVLVHICILLPFNSRIMLSLKHLLEGKLASYSLGKYCVGMDCFKCVSEILL